MGTRAVLCVLLSLWIGLPFAEARRKPKPAPLPELADVFAGKAEPPAKPLVMWYDRPGTDYFTALPIGNGRVGAMINGGVSVERIWLNEDSLWSSGPGELKEIDDETVTRVAEGIAEARKLFFEDKAADGQAKLFSAASGSGSAGMGCSQLLGMLDLHFAERSSVTDYRRELDLDEAISRVQYIKDGTRFTRECFASHPDQVIVVRLEADRKGRLSLVAKMCRGAGETTVADRDDTLVMRGQIGMKYIARAKIVPEGGKVSAKENAVHVEEADAVTILVSCATDYLPKPPTFRGNPLEEITARQIEAASKKSYSRLKQDHVKAHRKLFRRMSINLGSSPEDKLSQPTDVRLKEYSRNGDHQLSALRFQYARYLLISCSRPGSQPANLQGLWIGNFNPMWRGDYHIDMNLQMAYWLAGPCNIAECMLPVADLVEWTVPYGRMRARFSHGVRKGWVFHLVTNPHGYTGYVAHPRYGYIPGCSAWLMQTLWEYYAFTRDEDYLRRVWPMFKESGEFWLEWIVPDPETGKLVGGPSSSPETSFKVEGEGGQAAGLSMGPAFEQQCIWELFTEILEAADVLGIDDDFVKQVREAREKLQGPSISTRDGTILEWRKESYVGGHGHRHRSHLIALFPGRQITVEHTPELAKAAEKALDKRGIGGPPWTPAWDMSFNARLRRPEMVMKNVDLLTKLNYSIHPNFMARCGGLQVDGTLGYAVGVAECLVQSHAGHIELLPCLPPEWSGGSVTGICARGGFEIDMEWKAGELVSASLLSKCGGKCKVRYKGVDAELDAKKGKRYDLKESLKL